MFKDFLLMMLPTKGPFVVLPVILILSWRVLVFVKPLVRLFSGQNQVVTSPSIFHQEFKDMLCLSIQSSFDHFFKNEETEHRCEMCEHNRSFVVHTFSRLPRVIIIHVKHCIFTESRLMKKYEQHVTVSKYLNLSPHCDPNNLLVPLAKIHMLRILGY